MKRIFILLISLLVLMGCSTTKFTITDQVVKPIIDSQMAEIEDSMEVGTPIAVWWCDDERFEKEHGEKEHITTISYWIQGYMEQTLVKTRKFDVVTRTQLDKIFREQEFQYSGHVSEDTMVAIANILGAKYMVIPRITPLSTLNIQVLSSETGKIIYISDSALKDNQKIGK
jgi:curli biogenesis system outer membrane secretion channel CsgG